MSAEGLVGVQAIALQTCMQRLQGVQLFAFQRCQPVYIQVTYLHGLIRAHILDIHLPCGEQPIMLMTGL